jgi:hypothetical protein
MGRSPNNDQSQTNAFPAKDKVNRLPPHLVNPDGVYSGIARRNAMEDGEFFPQADLDKAKRRGSRAIDDE